MCLCACAYIGFFFYKAKRAAFLLWAAFLRHCRRQLPVVLPYVTFRVKEMPYLLTKDPKLNVRFLCFPSCMCLGVRTLSQIHPKPTVNILCCRRAGVGWGANSLTKSTNSRHTTGYSESAESDTSVLPADYVTTMFTFSLQAGSVSLVLAEDDVCARVSACVRVRVCVSISVV